MALAEADRGVLRQLTTRFDKRDINRNFSSDDRAYDEMQRNLGRLIAMGHVRPAMSLALELMKHGSVQVEMSDEGLMTDDIEDCLTELIETLRSCDLPSAEVIAWCSTMLDTDRVGFIATEPLQALRNHLQTTASR